MKMRRLVSCMMALLLAASLPVSALAEAYDLRVGSIEVKASETGQIVTQENGVQNHTETSPTIIKQEGSEATANTITISADTGSTANVTLNGVNIIADEAAIDISGDGEVVIELDGTNTVQSGEGHAGVEKDSSSALTILDNNDTQGSLTATGGDSGAGIGGAHGDGSNITISGGTVAATGGEGGAGIGGAHGDGSNITISGGRVTATGGTDAAGIGGGEGGDGSNITISGGRVGATGGDPQIKGSADAWEYAPGGGAGIGGGANGTGSSITILADAQVTAEGKGNAAHIGNGNALDATQRQENHVDTDQLSPNGSINGNSGSHAPGETGISGESQPADPDGGSNDSRYIISIPESIESSNGFITYKLDFSIQADDRTDVSFILIKLKEKTTSAPSAMIQKDSFTVTTLSDYISLSGSRDAVSSLLERGVTRTVLQTSDGNVTISNQLLEQFTGAGGSFQVTSDGGDVNITTTDQNHALKVDATVVAPGTQESSLQYGRDFEFSLDSTTGNGSQGSGVKFKSDVGNVSLTLSAASLKTMHELNIDSTTLALPGAAASFNNGEVLERLHADFGSEVNRAKVNLRAHSIQNANKRDHAEEASDNAPDYIFRMPDETYPYVHVDWEWEITTG